MRFNQNTTHAYSIWLFITLFYCYQYVLRLIPNIIMPELMYRFSLTAPEFGAFAGTYYIGYIIMQIPLGLLLSRFGVKLIIPLSILIVALGLLPIILSDSWQLIIFGRFLTGIGASAAIIGAFQIFRIIFPKHFIRMLGVLVSISLLAVDYISSPLSNMVKNIGVEQTVCYLCLAGVILALVTYLSLPKIPVSKSTTILSDLREIFSSRKILIVSILAGLMIAPLEGFADAWGAIFIQKVYNLDRDISLSLVATILTGMCIGSLVLPYLAEKTNSYYYITLISALVMSVCFIIMLSGIGNTSTLYLINFVIGLFSAYQVVIIPKIATYARLELGGTVTAVSNMIIMFFGYIFHKIIAYRIENNSAHEVIYTENFYTYQDYINGIAIIPLALLIAAVGFSIIILIKFRAKPKENSHVSVIN